MSRRAIARAAIVVAFLGVCAALGPIHPDRSFVAYRYAENLASGHGLAYNAGDAPSEGYGNTLWVVLCAALAKIGFVLPATAWLLSVLFGMLTLAGLWSVLRARVATTASVAAVGVAAVSGPLAIAAMSGEGVTLAAALVVAVVVLLDRAGTDRVSWVVAGASGALLATCGNALAIVFPAALVIRMRLSREENAPRAGWVLAATVFAAGVAAFLAWRLTTFGALAVRAPGFEAGRASLADLFVSQPYDMAPFGLFYLVLLVAAVAGARASKDPASSWLACGTAVVAGLVTLATRDPLPGLAGSAAMAALLAVPIASLVDAILRGSRTLALDAMVVAALLVASVGWAMDLRVSARHIKSTHDATLAPLGKWLAAWRSDGTILCDAPGAVPYYAGWRATVIGEGVALSDAPDVVMLTSEGLFVADMDETQTRIAAALAGRYRVLAAIRRDWTRDRAFIIYARDDIPKLTDDTMLSFPQGIGTVVRLNR